MVVYQDAEPFSEAIAGGGELVDGVETAEDILNCGRTGVYMYEWVVRGPGGK